MYNQIVTLTIADESDNSSDGSEWMTITLTAQVHSCCGVEMHHSFRTGVWHTCPEDSLPLATATNGEIKPPFHVEYVLKVINIINLIKTKGFDLENELDLDWNTGVCPTCEFEWGVLIWNRLLSYAHNRI